MSGYAKSQALTLLAQLLTKSNEERANLARDVKVAEAGERQHHAAAVEAVGRLRGVRDLVQQLYAEGCFQAEVVEMFDDAIGPESAE